MQDVSAVAPALLSRQCMLMSGVQQEYAVVVLLMGNARMTGLTCILKRCVPHYLQAGFGLLLILRYLLDAS